MATSVLQRSVLFTALTLLAGCDRVTDEGPHVDRTSGALADVRFQWSAAPGIDLLSGPAVPVRGYLESWGDAQAMGSLEYAYPGFERAVQTSSPFSAPEGSYVERDIFTYLLRPDDGVGRAQEAAVGNNRFRILSIDRSGTTVIVAACNYRYGMAVENANGTFSSVASTSSHDTGINAVLVRLDRPSAASDSALPPQSGDAIAPVDDVFGDWRITGNLNEVSRNVPGFAAAWPTYESDAAACVEQAPDPPDRRAYLMKGEHPRSDFPTSPPNPGWPST